MGPVGTIGVLGIAAIGIVDLLGAAHGRPVGRPECGGDLAVDRWSAADRREHGAQYVR